MSYKHISINERIYIEHSINSKIKVEHIAKCLNRHKSTINREIKRNKTAEKSYHSLLAQKTAEKRKINHIKHHKFDNKKLVSLVQSFLFLKWSPEQIHGRLKNFFRNLQVSFKTIYQWIYKGLIENFSKVNLTRKGKKTKSQEKRGKFNGKSINERDESAKNRKEIGHWEGDTIVSARGKSKHCLITLVERVSRFSLAILVPNRTAMLVTQNIIHHLSFLPNEIVKTITFDRGKEFSDWTTVEEKLNAKVYFADPHSPWQRGTNENTNGLIRREFPKKFNFSKTTPHKVIKMIKRLNDKPRKCLNYHSPFEFLVNYLN